VLKHVKNTKIENKNLLGIVGFSKNSKKSLENLYSNCFMNQTIHISSNYVYMEKHEHIQTL